MKINILKPFFLMTLLLWCSSSLVLGQQKKPNNTNTKKPTNNTKTQPTNTKTNNTGTKPTNNKQTTTNNKQTTNNQALSPDSPITAAEVEAYKKEATEMMSLVEYMVNTLGSSESDAEDKNTIITESYLKVFKDSKVSIEDDLDKKRDAVINKEAQSYLKDIDFFFTDAIFKFDVQSITHFLTPENQVVFKVTMNRSLRAKTVGGDSLNNNQVRYVEINLNQAQKDLKIASIYTTKLNEAEELKSWWATLSSDWKSVFGTYVSLPDTVSLAHIRNILNLERIDLSSYKNINDLEPLSRLTKLKEVNIANTQTNNLAPLRNLSNLEILNCSGTEANSLEPIKYAINLRELYCQNTQINNLEAVRNFNKLDKLYFFNTPISSLEPISGLTALRELRGEASKITDVSPLKSLSNLNFLDIPNTAVSDLKPLAGLSQLERLDFSNTQVKNLDGLQGLKKLKNVLFNNTQIGDLNALQGLSTLEKVYCDQSKITREIARKFMAANPNALVIFDSETLSNWWNGMSGEWKIAFGKYVKYTGLPNKDQLQQMANLTEMNVSNNQAINTLEPLKEVTNLKKLFCSSTSVSDFSPLKDLIDLQILEANSTKINNLRPLANLTNLEKISVENCALTTLQGIEKLNVLKILYCDKNTITLDQVDALNKVLPSCLVVHQSEVLRLWWQNLPDAWKQVFGQHVKIDNPPTREQTHQVATLEALRIDNNNAIRDLEPVRQLRRLKELTFSNTLVSNISPITSLKNLEKLDFSKNPVGDISSLTDMVSLKFLAFENTPANQLISVSKLINLEEINFSGTQISDLEALKGLTNLKTISFYSTRVSNLKDIMELPKLKTVKCYNTKVWQSRAKNFREKRPEVELIFY
jgi:Leucine-rich repeat (LRR) protein